MNNLKNEKFKSFLYRSGTLLLAFYVIFLLGKSVWTNYDLRQSIVKLNAQVAILEEQKKVLSDLNIYYQSDSFKELEARRKLGMKKADEKVVIVTSNVPSDNNFQKSLAEDQSEITQKVNGVTQPNWSLWLEFFYK